MDKRGSDRRKKTVKVQKERRGGPRRLTCDCGGKIDVKVSELKKGEFVCVRCGKNH